MLLMRQRGGLKLLRRTAALGFYLEKEKTSVDWIWELGSGCGLDVGVWNWILLFLLFLEALMCLLIAIYMVL